MGYIVWNQNDLFEILKGWQENDFDGIICIDGNTGCITGDTILNISRNKVSRKYKIKDLYEKQNGMKDSRWDNSTKISIRSFNGKLIKLNEIEGVVYSGIKKVYRLILEDGKSIKATFDHKIMTQNGMIELGKLDIKNDEVMVDEEGDVCFSKIKKIEELGNEETFDIQCKAPHHNFVANGMVISNSGKSTLALKLAMRFKAFNIKKDLIYSREELLQTITEKEKGVIIGDEIINAAHNRDFQGDIQKKLIKQLNMYRDSNNIFIMCIPNFYHLDTQLRDLCAMRIRVVRRGLAVIHKKVESSYKTDRWDSQVNAKIESAWVKNVKSKPKFNKLTTYIGMVKFGDLAESMREKYKALKKEKRGAVVSKELEEMEIGTKDKAKDKGMVIIEDAPKDLLDNYFNKIVNRFRDYRLQTSKDELSTLAFGFDKTPRTLEYAIRKKCKEIGLKYNDIIQTKRNKDVRIKLPTIEQI